MNTFHKALARERAEREIWHENFHAEVERQKARIRKHKPWWHYVLPFVITITRRS